MPRLFYILLSNLALLGSARSHSSLRSRGTGLSSTHHDARVLQGQVFDIPLIISLKFVNEYTASELESMDSENALVKTFCSLVQQQAAGSQVRKAATAQGITITTADISSQECTILDTYRVYSVSKEKFVVECFELEISLRQVVTATSQNPLNTFDQTVIQDLVETGFNRGSGGRVQFLRLLRENSRYFVDLLDVVVLSKLTKDLVTASPVSLSPSNAPSTITLLPTTAPLPLSDCYNHTGAPSSVPTSKESAAPSTDLSNNPSSAAPKLTPSSPTAYPSAAPSGQVTKSPVIQEVTKSTIGNNSSEVNYERISPVKVAFIVIGFLACLCLADMLLGLTTNRLFVRASRDA